MSDDGFHEIQLNGKQLVFLFMAATVVSVVIFLCGVMVGRGVRGERGDGGQASTDLATAGPVPASSPAPAPATVAGKGASTPTPPEPADDEAVTRALTAEKPADVTLQPRAKAAKPVTPEVPTPKPAATEQVAATPAPATAAHGKGAPAAASVAPAASPGSVTSGGFAVQITALRDRSEADAIVKRLVSKGYPAFVVNPLPGKPPVYRVQVGRFQDRAEADRVASRLQKEEQFSPWVTR